jgi:hypothetical protein
MNRSAVFATSREPLCTVSVAAIGKLDDFGSE